MNRTFYFNYVEDKLGTLSYRINLKGKLNILDLHLHSESFFLHFLNKLYGWNFINSNPIKQNIEAIDLIDHTNQCVCQVSATATKVKVESALSKSIIKQYPHYTFKFISISREGNDLRRTTFVNPHGIAFDPKKDIIDNKSILDFILGIEIERQEEIYKFIRKELGGTVDIIKLDSNLAVVINVLSKENFAIMPKPEVNKFAIEMKISMNSLHNSQELINDNAIFYKHINQRYKELDIMGVNKSFSVLQSIQRSHIEETARDKTGNQNLIFLNVIDNVMKKVQESANYVEIPRDELDFCVTVLVVDAFIRCKIFKNPTDYSYVTS